MRVAPAAVGPDTQVVPQQWLAHTTALGVPGAHFFLLLRNSCCKGCRIHINDMQLGQWIKAVQSKTVQS